MASSEAVAATPSTKPVNTIVLDSSPLLLNTPPLSTLLSQCNEFVSTPQVISEIRDEEARTRVETTYLPFLTLRSPKPESVKFVKDFARRTGDLAVLSGTDIDVIALAYDLEIEKNGGDWRLRNAPGQKHVNGKPPIKVAPEQSVVSEPTSAIAPAGPEESTGLSQAVGDLKIEEDSAQTSQETSEKTEAMAQPTVNEDDEDGSDSDGWITPSNIKRKQAKDETGAASSTSDIKVLQVATITGDFAMQNVLLQINLNLLSPNTCKRISNVRTMILRCHACFATTKEMNKQFCNRCGKPTLTRVTCTTNDRGEVKLHLKKNMQWNNKGNVFSMPKPGSGHSNQKWQGARDGGGKGGWGNHLILAEDQKEYVRARTTQERTKKTDLMDEDVLPSILTGQRQGSGGKVRIGGGRNINSRKR